MLKFVGSVFLNARVVLLFFLCLIYIIGLSRKNNLFEDICKDLEMFTTRVMYLPKTVIYNKKIIIWIYQLVHCFGRWFIALFLKQPPHPVLMKYFHVASLPGTL